MIDLLLVGGILADGRAADIAIVGDTIAAVEPSFAGDCARRIDISGRLVTAPFIDSHFHLDSTLSAGIPRYNRSGTLLEGIAIWNELKPTLTEQTIHDRARRLCEIAVARGNLAIRSHVDIGDPALRGVRALLALRDEMRPWIDIQLVAFPQEGYFRRPDSASLLQQAIELGVDAIGGIPHFERTREQGAESIAALCRLAADHGLPVDLHCDETDDPQSRHVETLAAEVVRHGLEGRATGSHLTSMHGFDNAYADKLVALMAEAELSVVANPLINITLQGRYDPYPKRRGMTRVKELLAAGITTGFGHDCVLDPWYRLGSHDMLEVASMGAHVGHMTGEADLRACFEAVTTNAARIMRLERYGIAPGCRADLVVLQAADPIEAIRLRATRLMVLRAGQVIAETAPSTTRLSLGSPSVLDLTAPRGI